MSGLRRGAAVVALGVALGYALSAVGFSDWGEVHRMFTLGTGAGGGAPWWRLALVFAGAVAVAMLGFGALARRDELPARPLHAGIVPGGLLFGAGWAISGACPAIALVQLGEGRLAALWTLAGILAGSWFGRRAAHRRHLGACG